jgi:hypothetical protein
MKSLFLILVVLMLGASAFGQNAESKKEQPVVSPTPVVYPEKAPDDPVRAKLIPKNSKVYIDEAIDEDPNKPQSKGFKQYLEAAFHKKSVHLIVVADRSAADFEISDSASSKGAGWAKKIILGDFRKSTTASIDVTNLRTGVVAFADSSDRSSANRGLRSAAEKLAKYLKKKMDADEHVK